MQGAFNNAGGAALSEKSAPTTGAGKNYTRDTVSLNEIDAQVELKFASLRSAVKNLFSAQRVNFGESTGLSYDQIMEKYDGKLKEFYQNLKVDESTRLRAQQDTSWTGSGV